MWGERPDRGDDEDTLEDVADRQDIVAGAGIAQDLRTAEVYSDAAGDPPDPADPIEYHRWDFRGREGWLVLDGELEHVPIADLDEDDDPPSAAIWADEATFEEVER